MSFTVRDLKEALALQPVDLPSMDVILDVYVEDQEKSSDLRHFRVPVEDLVWDVGEGRLRLVAETVSVVQPASRFNPHEVMG